MAEVNFAQLERACREKLRRVRLTACERQLAEKLLDYSYAKGRGEAWFPSQVVMAKLLHTNRSRVCQRIAALQDKYGIIKVEARTRKEGWRVAFQPDFGQWRIAERTQNREFQKLDEDIARRNVDGNPQLDLLEPDLALWEIEIQSVDAEEAATLKLPGRVERHSSASPAGHISSSNKGEIVAERATTLLPNGQRSQEIVAERATTLLPNGQRSQEIVAERATTLLPNGQPTREHTHEGARAPGIAMKPCSNAHSYGNKGSFSDADEVLSQLKIISGDLWEKFAEELWRGRYFNSKLRPAVREALAELKVKMEIPAQKRVKSPGAMLNKIFKDIIGEGSKGQRGATGKSADAALLPAAENPPPSQLDQAESGDAPSFESRGSLLARMKAEVGAVNPSVTKRRFS